jgi:hypothetical protein
MIGNAELPRVDANLQDALGGRIEMGVLDGHHHSTFNLMMFMQWPSGFEDRE